MNRIILAGLLLLLALPALAKPYHYPLLEDLQKQGDVGDVTDNSDMEMTFELNYPYWLGRYKTKRLFEVSQFGLESYEGEDSDEQAYVTSRWKVRSVDGAANFISGIDQARIKMEARLVNQGPKKTSLILSGRLQTQKDSRHGWADQSTREMRNPLREFGTAIALCCRYPETLINQESVREDYKDGKKLGKKGYEMPPKDTGYAREDIDKDYAAALAEQAESEPTPALSVADELRKLKELLDEGVLTPEEFESQKQKLLGD